MAVAVGQRCVVRIKITDVELRKARDIKATIKSPQGEEECLDVSFDEVSGLVYVSVDVNSVGSWSMWLGVRFAEELFYTPAFVFAEVEGDAKSCDAPYIVDVEVEGESVTVTPPKIDVDAVTQEEFDALVSKVESKVDKVEGKGLSTNDFTDEYKQKVDEFIIDTELSPTSDNAIANSAVVNGLAGLAEGVSEAIGNVSEQLGAEIETKANKDDYYPEMSVGMADKVKGVNKVQEELTLTTKPNGNIVIGNLAGQTKEFMPATPSGDPMHYAYEDAGALYNDTVLDITFIGVYGETITHKSNHWRLNDLGDLTNEEMQEIFNMRYPSVSGAYLPMWFGGNANARTNICSTHWSSTYEMNDIFVNNSSIESISLADSMEGEALPRNLGYAFFAAPSCHTIINKINLTYATLDVTTFKYCYSLKNIRLLNLHSDVSFADSPLLSKESLLYMINNCASNATFTITLHPDVYAKCQKSGEWYSEVNKALSTAQSGKTTTITLASA